MAIDPEQPNADKLSPKVKPSRDLPADKKREPSGYTHDNTGSTEAGKESDRATADGRMLPKFLGRQFARVHDPESKTPLYAVRKQKVVTLTEEQYKQLKGKTLKVGALGRKGGDKRIDTILDSLNENSASRVLEMDCPEIGDDGKPVFTVLLDWEENTSVEFPELRLIDTVNGTNSGLISQANNYLVVSFSDDSGGGTNNPPARPPITTSEVLNQLPSDFRPLAPGDDLFYKQNSGRDKGPAVAVLDTGLKFNLHNKGEEGKWPDAHVYRDANGQKRRFTLAYQADSDTGCSKLMKDNRLGYCALQAYRQQDFIDRMALLSNMPGPASYNKAHIINSPFDDCVVLKDANAGLGITNIKDARHGTSITAIVQQNGDDAPVLPVKAFDNLGYATLFDVLNGFNYILQRCESSNIRVVNTSWIFGRDEPLLKKKIEQLLKKGVFVIAAAGNKNQTLDQSLDRVNVYPACYSTSLPNVITVTSVRKTYLADGTVPQKVESLVSTVLSTAQKVGLSTPLDIVEDAIESVLPVQGYVAVENFSPTFVNVGVVSIDGLFRSPFWRSGKIRGSSYACAYVSGFVIRQLRTDAKLLQLVNTGTKVNVKKARKELLDAMSGQDGNLAQRYVLEGYYLSGHEGEQ